jgi:hypothetical protein
LRLILGIQIFDTAGNLAGCPGLFVAACRLLVELPEGWSFTGQLVVGPALPGKTMQSQNVFGGLIDLLPAIVPILEYDDVGKCIDEAGQTGIAVT